MNIEVSIKTLKTINSALSYYFNKEGISEIEMDEIDDILYEFRIIERSLDD